MRGRRKGLERLDKKVAVSKPPLCKGRWLGDSRDGGVVVVLPSPSEDNPSVSLTADSSLYTREPKEVPAFGANTLNPSALPSSVTGFARATFPQGKAQVITGTVPVIW